jgi:hypothetical protein
MSEYLKQCLVIFNDISIPLGPLHLNHYLEVSTGAFDLLQILHLLANGKEECVRI